VGRVSVEEREVELWFGLWWWVLFGENEGEIGNGI
jgi:hypothetical protein